MGEATSELILYACPTGELADQIEMYFQNSLKICGANAAHRYMPHCTLTGFFKDEEGAIAHYQQAVEQALAQSPPPPSPVITVTQMNFREDWHGLELRSAWLKQFVPRFADLAESPTRKEALRLKSWLHLSLAYDFSPDHASTLMQLATQSIQPQSMVTWELRFYQRHPQSTWTCHYTWNL
ncbi:MAG: hypothetical protein MUF49_15555 [Oculatellaceae cyanobacterium Prado106]|jgi:ubiquitin-associated SH3 domain-containing protein|nr:hypothetical protein [Oculatellaceae cyanobacterium Prado106]